MTGQVNEFSGSAVNVVQAGHIDAVHLHEAARPPVFLAPTRSSVLLVGRDGLRDRLHELAPGGSVALWGMPGAGKTALALSLAYDETVRERFPDGVLWAGLGARAEVQRQLSVWGAAVGLRLEDVREPGVRGWVEALHPVIAAGRYLLVIDDAWDADHALAFQLGGPACAHVLTTRLPGVAAEFGDVVVKVGELSVRDGVALLSALAPRAVAGDPAATARMVGLVGGLPLALTLIGHRLRLDAVEGDFRVVEALDRLRAAGARLALTRREAPAAAHPSLPAGVPVSLQATLDVGYGRLSGAARQALRDLAAFPAKPESFTVSRAWSVVPDREAVAEVVRAGLVESLPDNRYSMHQVVHDYAGGEGGSGAAERRLATVLFAQEGVMTPEEVDREFGTVLHALEHAHRHGMHETLLAGVDEVYGHLALRGLYSVAEKHLRHALSAARTINDTASEARTLVRLGSAVMEQGELREGGRYLVDGLRLAQQADLTGEIVELMVRLGWSAGMRGNLEHARRHFADALVGASGEEAIAPLQGLGWVAGLQGRHADSHSHLQRALELARQGEDGARLADVLQVAGWMSVQAGEYPTARGHFEECLAIAREVHQGSAEVDALHGLGWLAFQSGHYPRARQLLVEALERADQLGYHERMPIVLNLGRVAARTALPDYARARLVEAWELAKEQDRPEKLCDVLRELGRLELAGGDSGAAEPLLRESLAIAERIMVRTCLVDSLEALAEFDLAAGRIAAAREGLERASRLARTEPALLARLRLRLAEAEEAEHGAVAARDLYLAAFSGADRTGQDEVAALAAFGLARAGAAGGDRAEAVRLADDCAARFDRIGSPRAAEVRRWRDTELAPDVQ